MNISNEQIMAGQAIYTKFGLNLYDFVVKQVSNPLIWKCPTQRLVDLYSEHVTANHLDVGVGTGYYLDHCRFPSREPRIVLMDLNPNSLAFAFRRVARYKPSIHFGNALEPVSIDGGNFDSIGMNYLLHCVPGPISGSKAVVFDHLKALMNPGAVLFGSTLLHDGVHRSRSAKRLMDTYNRKGIFSNQEDTLEGLKRALNERFGDVSMEVVGCAAIFSCRV